MSQQESLKIAEEAREERKTQSFAAKLFMGELQKDLLLPYPKQDPDDKAIGDSLLEKLSNYLQMNLDPDRVDQERSIPQSVIDELAKMGLFAMKIPKEYGGLGLSHTNYNRIVMKVASYCGSTAVLLSAHQSIGVPQPLNLFGKEDQKKRYFPRFVKGAISAFALTEDEVGSDPARIATEAVLSEDETHYLLNGTKVWCTNGTIADVIIVIAKTAPKKEKKQISAFIVEMDSPGVEVIHRCEFMGLNGIYNGIIRFTNVKVPTENLLGEEGRGLAMALATINVGRLTLPAACTGTAKQCLSIARRWGKERVQWGSPVGLHEMGREKMSFIAATTLAMEAMTWFTCSFADRNIDIRIEAAMAKLFCTESLWKIVDLTMQLRGGRGYEKATSLTSRGEEPYPVERIMRDCRVNLILEGSSEIMKLFLAREALDPHLKRLSVLLNKQLTPTSKALEMAKLFGHYALWYPLQWIQKSSSYSTEGDLAPHFRFCEKTAHRLARALVFAMAKHHKKLEAKQLLLGRLIEIGTDLFAILTTCSYAISLNKEPSAIEVANYFSLMARRRIKDRFQSLSDHDDAITNHLAKRILDREMTWLEEGIFWIGKKES